MYEKINNFVAKLQSQTHLPLWMLSNEVAIYATAVNSKPAWGKKTKLLNFLINIAEKMKAADLLIFSLGLARAFSLWMRMKAKQKNKKTNHGSKFSRIFFSFKVSSEEYIYSEYKKKSKNTVLKIDSISLDGTEYFDKPEFKLILSFLFQYAFGYTAKLKKIQSEINLNTKVFLTVSALNIGTYAFYRAFWRMLKQKDVKEVAFITLDIPLHACIDEGIPTIYLQHGLLSRTLLIPKVDHFYTLTHDEEAYLKKLAPDIRISRTTYLAYNNNSIKNNIIMILSPDKFMEDFYKVRQFINQPIFNDQHIVIRPSPGTNENTLHILLQGLPNAVLDDLNVPLHLSIEKWNPKLMVAGWMSTGLATALAYGCLPISLYDPDIEDKWMKRIYPNDYWNTIYSIKSRVLFWPRDYQTIKRVMISKTDYEAEIKKLRSCLIKQTLSVHSCDKLRTSGLNSYEPNFIPE